MDFNNKRIAKNTLYLYARMLVVMVVTLFTSRVVLSTLGASDYGVYNVVGGIVTMMVFINGAMSSATSRFLTYELASGNQDSLNKTFSITLNLHILVAMLVILVGEPLGLWLINNKLIIPSDRVYAAYWILHFSVITTAINFTQVPYFASLISHESMSIYAYVGLYEAVSKLLIAYLLYIAPFDRLIFYGALCMLNTIAIQLFYRWYLTHRYQECHFRMVYDKPMVKKLLSYTGWELFGGVASISQGQVMNILLNAFFGPIVNAARAVSVQIQSAITGFVQNFLTASKPQIVKRYAVGEYESMYNLMFKTSKLAFLMMLCLMLPIAFEIDLILNIWLGDAKPEYTGQFAILILITELFQVFDYSQLSVFHAIGKIKTGSIIGGTLLFLSLPVSYFALKLGYPPYSVFVIMFIFKLLNNLTDLYLIHRYLPFSLASMVKTVYAPCFLISILACIAPFIVTHYLESSIMRAVITLFLTEICLLFFIATIGLSSEERNMVLSKIKLRFND